MNTLSPHFSADVRYPIGYPDLDESKWFQWRTVPMIELSALDTYLFVKSMIPHPAQKILEIGCGNGYLTLELARDGHDVIGIDLSQDIIEVAERTRGAHPDPTGFGSLHYICADVNTWSLPEASFDAVIFNRALHHWKCLKLCSVGDYCMRQATHASNIWGIGLDDDFHRLCTIIPYHSTARGDGRAFRGRFLMIKPGKRIRMCRGGRSLSPTENLFDIDKTLIGGT